MNAITGRWKALSLRERILVSILVVLIASYLIFIYIWTPANAFVDNKVRQVQERIDLYTALEPRIDAARAGLNDTSANKVINRFSGNAMVAVEEAISEHELNDRLSLASPSGESISVWFTNIQFNDWLQWVDTMRKRGVIVSEAKVSTSKSREGDVNIKALVTPVQ